MQIVAHGKWSYLMFVRFSNSFAHIFNAGGIKNCSLQQWLALRGDVLCSKPLQSFHPQQQRTAPHTVWRHELLLSCIYQRRCRIVTCISGFSIVECSRPPLTRVFVSEHVLFFSFLLLIPLFLFLSHICLGPVPARHVGLRPTAGGFSNGQAKQIGNAGSLRDAATPQLASTVGTTPNRTSWMYTNTPNTTLLRRLCRECQHMLMRALIVFQRLSKSFTSRGEFPLAVPAFKRRRIIWCGIRVQGFQAG